MRWGVYSIAMAFRGWCALLQVRQQFIVSSYGNGALSTHFLSCLLCHHSHLVTSARPEQELRLARRLQSLCKTLVGHRSPCYLCDIGAVSGLLQRGGTA